MTFDQEPDPDLAAELRRTAGREWAEEAAEDEKLTELMRRRAQSLSDVVRELASRAVRVTINVGEHTFTGPVVWASQDVAVVRTPGQEATFRLDRATWEILAAAPRGEAELTGPESFPVHLHETAAAAARVGLLRPGPEIPVGVITLIARDHVEFGDPDGRVLAVPLELVLGTIRSVDSH